MMKDFLRFCVNHISVRERAAMLLAALFENFCILLASYSLTMLVAGMAGRAFRLPEAGGYLPLSDYLGGLCGYFRLPEPGGYLLVLTASLCLQAVCNALGRDLLSGISGRVRLAYRQRLHRLAYGQGVHRPALDGLAEYCCEHVDALDEFFQKVVPLALAGLIRLPLFLLVFFWLDAVSGMIALVTMPIAPVMLYLLGRMAARASAAQWDRQSELNRGFYELMQGIVTLKLFRRTAAALEEMEELSRQHSSSSLKVLRIAFLSAFAVELLTTLSIAVLAVGIGLRILAGGLDFATGFLVLLLAPEFFLPVRSAGMAFHVLMNTRTALGELSDRLGGQDRLAASRLSGSSPGGRPAGAPRSIELPRGIFAVVTGSSGAGKTTLLRKMAGLLPSEGERFVVAGYDLGGLADGQRQEIIGYVPQEPHVYAASLRDNLRLGRELSDAALEEALQLAGLDSWYAAIGGLAVQLGDGGVSLSNGQRHRLGLARAMLGSPPVLLLDEVTAGLEPHEEQELLDMLQGRLPGRTVVLATHRWQAVSRADKVIEVEAETEAKAKIETEPEIKIKPEIEVSPCS